MESIDNVDKTLVHISHLHTLKVVASPEPRPICHVCNMSCSERSYGCIQCHYFLHITCATVRRTVDHPSHPAHTLNLELSSPYPHGKYSCKACGLDGSTFCLRCRECSYDLHLHCATIPHKINHRSHRHPLTLKYKNPYPPNTRSGVCDLCNKYVDVNKWFYLCRFCDYRGHVGCFFPKRREVISPGLQAPPDDHQQPLQRPSPQPSQQQPNMAATTASRRNTLLQVQRQLMQSHAQRMSVNIMNIAGQDI